MYYNIDKVTHIIKSINYGALNSHVADLARREGYKVYYMPNGIEFSSFSNHEPNNESFCLFVGRIDKQKAPHLAIKIAEELKIRLKIVGPINDYDYFNSIIKNKLSNNIEYLGEISRVTLDNLYKEAKCLILTSQWSDPQPTVVLESLSKGTPVIILNTIGYYSGVFDMVENNVNGFIGNIEEIKANADSIFNMDKRSVYLKSKEKWEWENVLRNYHVPIIEKIRIEAFNK